MEANSIRSLCVYCGSNEGASPSYVEQARALAAAMTARGISLVYGAGNVGLMGTLADEVLARGGRAVGVIPHKLADLGLSHPGISETLVVPTMRERKALMIERSDAFVALPGGIGTLEEFAEVMTLNQLGYESKPLGLLDVGGFWKPLVALLHHMVAEGFLKQAQVDQIVVEEDPTRLLDGLLASRPSYVPKWLDKGPDAGASGPKG